MAMLIWAPSPVPSPKRFPRREYENLLLLRRRVLSCMTRTNAQKATMPNRPNMPHANCVSKASENSSIFDVGVFPPADVCWWWWCANLLHKLHVGN